MFRVNCIIVCSSSSNISTKYDPDLLKSDVAHARERVTRLKRELEQIGVEMSCTRRGVETLSKYVYISLYYTYNFRISSSVHKIKCINNREFRFVVRNASSIVSVRFCVLVYICIYIYENDNTNTNWMLVSSTVHHGPYT